MFVQAAPQDSPRWATTALIPIAISSVINLLNISLLRGDDFLVVLIKFAESTGNSRKLFAQPKIFCWLQIEIEIANEELSNRKVFHSTTKSQEKTSNGIIFKKIYELKFLSGDLS